MKPRLRVPSALVRLLGADSREAALDALATFIVEHVNAFATFEPRPPPVVGYGFQLAPVTSGCRRVAGWGAE